jgi:hypothetical protein
VTNGGAYPEGEDYPGDEAAAHIAALGEEIKTLPEGPHRANKEAELRRLKAEQREPKPSGALRPLMR